MKTNGILLAVSSLPSKYGIGDFGKEAYEFIDYLKEAKIKIWQVLPLNPIGYGNSPYQSECGSALDPLYISLDLLYEDKYLKSLPKSFNKTADRVDYDAVRNYKEKYLKEAFKNQKDLNKKEFKDFIRENKWVEKYAKFHYLFLKNNYLEWYKWNKEERYDCYDHKVDYSKARNEINYYIWLQFIAYKQFNKLREYANKNNVLIMGDIPFYVGGMSSDVWSDQDEFLLDENDAFTYIAGVPPDYFSKTGQRWGNPIYDFEQLKKEHYELWINRFKDASKLFDILRIDHFRAFDTYYKIPVSCPTAEIGTWEIGPREDLFNELKKANIKLDIIAEDLGELFPSVVELKNKLGLCGMHIIEFDFLNKTKNIEEKEVVYTGTHDNDTLLSWYKNLTVKEKRQVNAKLKKLKIEGNSINEKLLRYAYNSKAKYVIIPMQDLLEQDGYYRMNTPGTCQRPNWEYRLINFKEFENKLSFIKKIVKESKR